MNFPTRKLLFTTLAALWLLPSVAALAESRWLLVFNTSSAMKKRLPAVEAEVRTLLLADFSRSLRADDGLGVWTLNDKLHTGQLPLITWSPETASSTVSNLVAFVHRQSYSGSTSFAALQPLLDQVIADSERLTVVIICDGEDEIHGTPYDDGLNDTIKQTRDARKNLHQPFVIVLRTQMGKFTGATVNFPPVPANLPPFPLLLVGLEFASLSAGLAITTLFTFGEEFGWTGYLLPRLLPLGRARATLIYGVIWGLWHAPIVAGGFNYPGHPVAGIGMMCVFTCAVGTVQTALILRYRSVVMTSLLHASINCQARAIWPLLFAQVAPLWGGLVGLLGAAALAVVGMVLWRGTPAGDSRDAAMMEK